MQNTPEHSLSGSRNTENAAGDMSVEQEATRDQKFWFRDGNVVLQAGGVAFRVYQGTLYKTPKCSTDCSLFCNPCSRIHSMGVQSFNSKAG